MRVSGRGCLFLHDCINLQAGAGGGKKSPKVSVSVVFGEGAAMSSVWSFFKVSEEDPRYAVCNDCEGRVM